MRSPIQVSNWQIQISFGKYRAKDSPRISFVTFLIVALLCVGLVSGLQLEGLATKAPRTNNKTSKTVVAVRIRYFVGEGAR